MLLLVFVVSMLILVLGEILLSVRTPIIVGVVPGPCAIPAICTIPLMCSMTLI